MFLYQQYPAYFAQIAGGLEETGAAELGELGASHIRAGFRGIHFQADLSRLMRIRYEARLISRILAPLHTFACHSDRTLYKQSSGVPWESLFSPDRTFAVDANVSNSRITHSKFAALRVKDAIADRFRTKAGKRPDVNPKDPDIRFHLFLQGNKATLSLDLTGDAMHRRGYRILQGEAPMRETVAAAVARVADWDGHAPLADPMCGSGTLLAEALMRAFRIPAGYLQGPGHLQHLPEFEAGLWNRMKAESDRRILPVPPGRIRGSDIDPEAVRAARTNLSRLPGGTAVVIERQDFRDIPAIRDAVIITNPPYGLRLQDVEKAGDLIREFGDFLKQRCTGSTAFIYTGRRELLKKVGLKTAMKLPLKNGPLDGRLARFDLY